MRKIFNFTASVQILKRLQNFVPVSVWIYQKHILNMKFFSFGEAVEYGGQKIRFLNLYSVLYISKDY